MLRSRYVSLNLTLRIQNISQAILNDSNPLEPFNQQWKGLLRLHAFA